MNIEKQAQGVNAQPREKATRRKPFSGCALGRLACPLHDQEPLDELGKRSAR